MDKEVQEIFTRENGGELTPKNDVIFKNIFSKGNEEITKSFISSIIKEDIKEIEMDVATILPKEEVNSKLGILDLRVKLGNDVQCNIEVQLVNRGDILERMLFYWSKLFSSQLNSGEKYKKLNRTISIAILDFEIEELKEIEEFYTNWKIIENKNRKKILTEKLNLYIIEIPKLVKSKNKELKDKLTGWMLFLDNPRSREVMEIMKENKEIKEAGYKFDEITSDAYLKRIAEWREKALWDEASLLGNIEDAKEEAKKEGREEGRKEGKEEGKEEGIKEGIEKIVIKMLRKKMEDKFIMEITGIDEEKLNDIKIKYKLL